MEDSPVGLEAAYNGGMMSINIPDLKEPDDEVKRIASKICEFTRGKRLLIKIPQYISKYERLRKWCIC